MIAMRQAAIPLLLLIAAQLSLAARPVLASDDRATAIVRVFEQARAHDASAILGARATAHRRGDRSLDDVFGLALYVADSRRYVPDFVAAFPTSAAGVMNDYAQTIGAGHLVATPVFPFRALGTIAASGDLRAFDKLYRAYAVSDGFAAQSLADAFGTAAHAKPAVALTALAALPGTMRERLAGDSALWCANGAAAAVGRNRPQVASTNVLRARIARAAKTCSVAP